MTPLGIILVIVGLAALLRSRKSLYCLFLYSIPFSGTSVLNIGSGESGTGVQVWMYFGALLLFRDLCEWLLHPDFKLAVPLAKRGLLLMIVMFVLAMSLVMPLYINGRLLIVSPILTDFSTSPLYFSSKNLTAFLYVLFGSLLTMSIARRNLLTEDVNFTQKTYLAAGLLTCILGLFESLAHLFHFPSPTLLFRNSASFGAQGYAGLLESGFTRVSSVAVEPSILVQYLCTVLPLTMPTLLGKGKVISRTIDRLTFMLIGLIFLLSASSIAYLTLLALPILCLPIISKLGIKTIRIAVYSVLFSLGVVGGLTFFYVASPIGRVLLNDVLLAKSSSYSALERLKTISYAWEYFKLYPFLGVGWGSVTSHDVIMMILANSGLAGICAFVLCFIGIGRPLYQKLGTAPLSATSLSRAMWLLSGVILTFACLLSEFPVAFGYLWLVLGMATAAGLPSYRQALLNRTSGSLPALGIYK